MAALLYILLTLHGAGTDTPTVDEFAHLPAGCAYWKHGSFDLYAKNPPIVKLWMALPVVADPRVQTPPPTGTGDWAPWEYGTAFMNANRDRYLDTFFRARIMILLLGLATGGLLFLWARRLFPLPVAAIATALFLLSPTVLAHSHLATVDAGSMFTILLAILAFERARQRRTTRRVLLAGAAFGVALAAKFTAVLLLPAFGLLLLLPAPRRSSSSASTQVSSSPASPRGSSLPASTRGLQAPAAGRRAVRAKSDRHHRHHGAPRGGVLAAGRDLVWMLLAAALVVNAVVLFAGSFRALGSYTFRSASMQQIQQGLPSALPVPLPASYVSGFDLQRADTETGEFGSYLLGRWSDQGWWYYNLFALAVKEPEPFLLLLVMAPWFWIRHRRRTAAGTLAPLIIPLLALLIPLSLFNKLNLGVRYLLPAFPLLYLLAAKSIDALWSGLATGSNAAFGRREARRSTGATATPRAAGAHALTPRAILLRATVFAALAYQAVTAVAVGPHHLGYFNPLSGGPSRGAELLLDSNLDWGQDLHRVREIAQEAGDEPLGLLYFGHVDPAIYGIDYRPVPPRPVAGLLAVSANFVKGYSYVTPLPDGKIGVVSRTHLEWLRSAEPQQKLGSIWVYNTR